MGFPLGAYGNDDDAPIWDVHALEALSMSAMHLAGTIEVAICKHQVSAICSCYCIVPTIVSCTQRLDVALHHLLLQYTLSSD